MTNELLFDLFLAIATVETACNPSAIGDNGQAVGIVQIHPEVVEDVNRLTGTRFTPAARLTVKQSYYMFRVYLQHYGGEGDDATPEKYARIWNGGPKGHKKKATELYWSRLNEILKSPAALEAARRIVQRNLAKEVR
jgi:hypothetical protein